MSQHRAKSHRLARLVAAGTAGAALLALTGCAQVGDVAIKVDGTTYTSADVDLFTDFQCGYLAEAAQSPEAAGQIPAMSRKQARSEIATFLVSSVLDAEIAEEAGAEADKAQVQQTITQLDPVIKKVAKGADRERLVELISTYLSSRIAIQNAVIEQIGEQTLQGMGQEAGTQAIEQAIANARAAVAKDADIEIDPVFGLDDDGLRPVGDASLSEAVSTFAKQSVQQAPPATWFDALPKNQRCS